MDEEMMRVNASESVVLARAPEEGAQLERLAATRQAHPDRAISIPASSRFDFIMNRAALHVVRRDQTISGAIHDPFLPPRLKQRSCRSSSERREKCPAFAAVNLVRNFEPK